MYMYGIERTVYIQCHVYIHLTRTRHTPSHTHVSHPHTRTSHTLTRTRHTPNSISDSPHPHHSSHTPSQVSWQKNDMDGNINFYSISGDGRVVTWKLVKNELQYQDALKLKTTSDGNTTQDAVMSKYKQCQFDHRLDILSIVFAYTYM